MTSARTVQALGERMWASRQAAANALREWLVAPTEQTQQALRAAGEKWVADEKAYLEADREWEATLDKADKRRL